MVEPTAQQLESGEYVITGAEPLRRHVSALFESAGLSAKHAAAAADILVTADLRDVDTHGVVAVPRYFQLMESGVVDPKAEPEVLRESPSSAVITNARGLGLVGGYSAMELAIEKAKTTGIAQVGIVEGRHIGMTGYYAMMAARQDMIGMAVTNANRSVRPTHGARARFGTNPIAFAAPAGVERPFVLDMATSTVANGKIRRANRNGTPVPRGWIVDEDGRPLEQAPATRSDQWSLTPLGETATDEGANHKGYGLAVMVDVLAGVLTGGGTSADLEQDTNMAWFMAIDITPFRPIEEFKAEMDRLIQYFHATPAVDRDEPVLVAGDPQADAFERRSREGIPLPHYVLTDLRELAVARNLPVLL